MFNVLHVGICSMKNVNILLKQYFHYGGYCMSDYLRPCPFCGGQAKLLSLELGYSGGKVYGVFCQDDLKQEFQHGHFVDNHSSPQEAIDDWNGRVNP